MPFDVLEPMGQDLFLVTISLNGSQYTIYDSLAQEKNLLTTPAFCRFSKDSGFVALRDGVYAVKAFDK